jgi:hypothetical protein
MPIMGVCAGEAGVRAVILKMSFRQNPVEVEGILGHVRRPDTLEEPMDTKEEALDYSERRERFARQVVRYSAFRFRLGHTQRPPSSGQIAFDRLHFPPPLHLGGHISP